MNNITKFILKLCTSYSKYFNKKYNRTGKLFEDKFKSVHISRENQSKFLFSYIHLNPVKLILKNWKEEGIKDKNMVIKFLNDYKWSSYKDFIGTIRSENKIIDKDFPLEYFPTQKSFKKEIFEWLKLETGDGFS
jgi:putative transposase